jgi:hypothetical protein
VASQAHVASARRVTIKAPKHRKRHKR